MMDGTSVATEALHMEPQVYAKITFMPTESDGRSSPIQNGYRPQFYYRGIYWQAIHRFAEATEVRPGETALSAVNFTNPEEHIGWIYPQMPFLLCEGRRTVAEGRVLELKTLGIGPKKPPEIRPYKREKVSRFAKFFNFRKEPDPLKTILLTVVPEVANLMHEKFAEVCGVPMDDSGLAQPGLIHGELQVLDYVWHGEAGVGIEHLIYMVIEAELQISSTSYAALKTLRDHWGYDLAGWEQLTAYVKG